MQQVFRVICSAIVLMSVSCAIAADLKVTPEAGSGSITAASAPPAATTPASDQLPAKVDLRPQLTEYGLGPRSQGHRNTCSVFTTTAALEFALAKQQGKGEPLSVEYLNWACNQVIGNKTEDRGQFFHHLTQAFRQYGICTEAEMPYTRRFKPEAAPSEEAQKHAGEIRKQPFEIHWIKRIRPEGRLTDEQFLKIKKTLARGYPVASGASHSRLLVGYIDDETKPGGGLFLTKDSGEGRFSEVTYEFAKNELNDAFWVGIASAE